MTPGRLIHIASWGLITYFQSFSTQPFGNPMDAECLQLIMAFMAPSMAPNMAPSNGCWASFSFSQEIHSFGSATSPARQKNVGFLRAIHHVDQRHQISSSEYDLDRQVLTARTPGQANPLNFCHSAAHRSARCSHLLMSPSHVPP